MWIREVSEGVVVSLASLRWPKTVLRNRSSFTVNDPRPVVSDPRFLTLRRCQLVHMNATSSPWVGCRLFRHCHRRRHPLRSSHPFHHHDDRKAVNHYLAHHRWKTRRVTPAQGAMEVEEEETLVHDRTENVPGPYREAVWVMKKRMCSTGGFFMAILTRRVITEMTQMLPWRPICTEMLSHHSPIQGTRVQEEEEEGKAEERPVMRAVCDAPHRP